MYSAAPEYRVQALGLGAQAFVLKSDMDRTALNGTIGRHAQGD